jgi:hypothetical protein
MGYDRARWCTVKLIGPLDAPSMCRICDLDIVLVLTCPIVDDMGQKY